jgi:LysM repeat protein
MSRRRRKPRPGAARYLAPAAFLAGVTIAVLLVNAGLNGRKADTTTTVPGPVTHTQSTTTTTKGKLTRAKRFYTVQTGDTFGSIASRVGISITQLQALNPGVSSNALQVGQRLRVK